ncbi:hypothetical protein F5884DRAFT_344717 [Xylogone sp. PMI_703]|nr:hypothetical protein F5884DRAFT_344717 [Xylogone sp. PMI_703]
MQDRPVRGRGSQRPCDFCRTRKKRCRIQGSLPCSMCQKAGQSCTFRELTTRRRRPSQPLYPSGSPTQSTPSFPAESPPEVMDTAPLPVDWSPSLPYDDEMNVPLDLPSLFDWNAFGPDPHPDPVVLTGEGAFQPPLITLPITDERVISGEASEKFLSMDDPSEYVVSFLGPSAELDPSLRRRYVFNKGGAFRAGIRTFRRSTTAEGQNSMFLMTPRIAADHMAETLAPALPNHSVLAQFDGYQSNLRVLFNRFVNPTYPVPINALTDVGSTTPQYSTPSSAAVLAMIYSSALPWRAHDSKLPWARYEGNFEPKMPPDTAQIHRFVWQCISRDIYSPSYATIQAALLFMERSKPPTHFYETPFDSCLVSSLVTLSFTLGLHRDPTDWDLVTAEVREHRRWLWWLIYVQERWKCAVMGLRPSIREDDFDTSKPALNASIINYLGSPIPSSDLDTDDILRETHFALLLSLTGILDQILKFMTTTSRHKHSDMAPALDTATHLESILASWRTTMLRAYSLLENLPSPFASPSRTNPTIVHFGNLKIAFIYCRILIYRAVLQVSEIPGPLQTQDLAVKPNQNHPQVHAKAMEFLDLVEEELESLTLVNFSLFWFSWSRPQFNAITDFLVLLYVSAPNSEAKVAMRLKIEKHRHWLWVHSNHIHLTRVSLVRLDSMLSATEAGKLR